MRAERPWPMWLGDACEVRSKVSSLAASLLPGEHNHFVGKLQNRTCRNLRHRHPAMKVDRDRADRAGISKARFTRFAAPLKDGEGLG